MLDLDLEWIAAQELLDNNNLAIKICRFNLMRAARQGKETPRIVGAERGHPTKASMFTLTEFHRLGASTNR